MSRAYSVSKREAIEVTPSPFGSVGELHAGSDLRAWWIYKEHEKIDPEWTIFSCEDVLFVVSGRLKLEFRDGTEVVLETGDAFAIQAGTAFRGYRWPRDAEEPCLFIAVARADVETTKEAVEHKPR